MDLLDAPDLDARQLRAVELFMGGATVPEVAAALDVHRATVWRWTVDRTFAAELARERGGRRGALRDRLDASAGEALDVLLSVLRDSSARPGDRLRAAVAVLDRVPTAADVEPALLAPPEAPGDAREQIARLAAALGLGTPQTDDYDPDTCGTP